MAGTPIRRARREAAAMAAIEGKALQQAKEREQAEPRPKVEYSEELRDEIAALIADGTPIDDLQVNGAVLRQGIASRIGITTRELYAWQTTYPDLADAVTKAREESADRIADRKLALADVALSDPALANAVRVAGAELEWAAKIRNRGVYGDKPVAGGGLSYIDDLNAIQSAIHAHHEAVLKGEPSVAYPIRINKAIEQWQREGTVDISFDAFVERLKQLDAVAI